MPDQTTLFEALRTVGGQDDTAIDLADTALLFAALDNPEQPIDPYRDHLRQLALDATAIGSASDSVDVQAERLKTVISDNHGYVGDIESYEDMRNADLMHVIDRRRGLPVALGILYIHAGRAYGAEIHGLGFPGHFLVRIEARGQRAILDPFHGGQVITAADMREKLKQIGGAAIEIQPAHYHPVGNRDILLRLQNNIKLRAIRDGDIDRALAVLDRMRLIAPQTSELCQETALLQYQCGNLKRAINTLETFMAGPGGADARLAHLLENLRNRMN